MNAVQDEDSARGFVAERCNQAAFEKLESLLEALRDANQRQNLVSASSLDHAWQRHIADSAQLLDHVSRETALCVDLGSGAGFPGLVVAIMKPAFDVVLIESRKLRIAWLADMIEHLSLSNCRIVGCDVRKAPPMTAGAISARAFAPLERIVAFSARFSTPDTEWVLPKGRSAAQELASLPPDLRAMFHVEQSVTDPQAGIVVGKGRIEGRA